MNEFDAFLVGPIDDPDLTAMRRAQFVQANASLALEGFEMSADDLAIQERVIKGELTHDQAVAQYLKIARQDD